MKIKGLFTLSFLICLLNTACDNELDVNAEFEEVMYVYGLLEINEPTQYIRIQKNYLDPKTSALTLADDPSQTYYPVEDLIVEMGPTGTDNYILLVADTLAKEEGIFSSESNIIYKYDSPLEADKEYELRITNTVTGTVTSATTEVVQGLATQRPPSGNSFYTISLVDEDLNGNNEQLEFLLLTPKAGKVFEAIFRLHFIETRPNKEPESKYVDVTLFKQITTNNTRGGQALSQYYVGQSVINVLSNKLERSSEITRQLLSSPGEFIVSSGENELWDYYRVNVLSQTGITSIESQPAFTNIINGFGLFSSRQTIKRPNIRLTPETLEYLICNENTKDLNFTSGEFQFCN